MKITLFDLDSEKDQEIINGLLSFRNGVLWEVIKNTLENINQTEQDTYDTSYDNFNTVLPEVIYSENIKVMSRRATRKSIVRLIEQFCEGYSSVLEK